MTKDTGQSRVRSAFAALAQVPFRFPVPLACAMVWAGATIADQHGWLMIRAQGLSYIQVYLLAGFFMSLSAKLFAEGRGWRADVTLALTAVCLGLLALIIFPFGPAGNAWETPAWLFLVPAFVLLMTVAPFLDLTSQNHQVWNFNFHSWVSAAFGLLVALVIALGLIAALGAIETLFGVDVDGDIYGDIWIISLAVIWPWQTLSGVPGGFDTADGDYCPRWAGYLISWMLAPLALLYLLLLFAFALKIGIQWDLPRGQIGWLIVGFAGFGVAVWLAAHPLRESGGALVRLYHRWFHAALVVPVVLLAVGTGARIADYGVTEPRYGLVLLAVWLAGLGIYGVVARTPRLIVHPSSLAILLVLASFGPWGAAGVSMRSQLAQLDALLVESGILSNDRIVRPEENLSTEYVIRLSGVVDYLSEKGRRRALVTHLAARGLMIEESANAVEIVSAMGLEYMNEWSYRNSRYYSRAEPDVIEVEGFDAVVRANVGPERPQWRDFGPGDRHTTVVFRLEAGKLNVTAGNLGPASFDLAAVLAGLRENGETAYDHPSLARHMTLEAEENGLKVRLYIQSISGSISGNISNLQSLSFLAAIGRSDRSSY